MCFLESDRQQVQVILYLLPPSVKILRPVTRLKGITAPYEDKTLELWLSAKICLGSSHIISTVLYSDVQHCFLLQNVAPVKPLLMAAHAGSWALSHCPSRVQGTRSVPRTSRSLGRQAKQSPGLGKQHRRPPQGQAGKEIQSTKHLGMSSATLEQKSAH